jgi:hypothetical protein
VKEYPIQKQHRAGDSLLYFLFNRHIHHMIEDLRPVLTRSQWTERLK